MAYKAAAIISRKCTAEQAHRTEKVALRSRRLVAVEKKGVVDYYLRDQPNLASTDASAKLRRGLNLDRRLKPSSTLTCMYLGTYIHSELFNRKPLGKLHSSTSQGYRKCSSRLIKRDTIYPRVAGVTDMRAPCRLRIQEL